MPLDTFDAPPCERLRWLKQIRRRLRTQEPPPSQPPPAGPSPLPCDSGETRIWDGPAYLAATCQIDQSTVPTPVAVGNLGRSYTARGLTSTNYYRVNNGAIVFGLQNLLPANPSRRMLAIQELGVNNIVFGWSADQIDTTLNYGIFIEGNTPTIFTDDVWGAWVTYPVWVFTQQSGGIAILIWEEVYLSYKLPTLG